MSTTPERNPVLEAVMAEVVKWAQGEGIVMNVLGANDLVRALHEYEQRSASARSHIIDTLTVKLVVDTSELEALSKQFAASQRWWSAYVNEGRGMTTDITDVIAQAIATAQEDKDDVKLSATAAAEAFAAAQHAYTTWKPEGTVIETLVVKLVLDTSEAEAEVVPLEKRAAASKSVACVDAAREWADQVLTNVSQGLPMPPLPELLLTLAAIGQGPR